MKHTFRILVVAASVVLGGSPLAAQLFAPPTSAPILGAGNPRLLVAPFDPGGFPDLFLLYYPYYDGTAQMMNPGQVGVTTPVVTGQLNLLSDEHTQPLVAHLRSAALLDVVRNEYFYPHKYLNDGAGNLVLTGVLPTTMQANWQLRDLNGDGLDDILEAPRALAGQPRQLLVRINSGNAVFTVAQTLSFGSNAVANPYYEQVPAPLVADLNGDGYPDLVVLRPDQAHTAQVFLNDGAGTFTAGAIIPNVPAGVSVSGAVSGGISPSSPPSLSTADFNGDGHRDLWAAYGTTFNGFDYSAPYAVTVWPGNGDGTFGAPVARALTGFEFGLPYEDEGGGSRALVRDVDGDGLDDIVFGSTAFGPGSLAVCHGSATSVIDPPTFAGGPANALFAHLWGGMWADIDGDGALDYVAVAYRAGSPTAAQPPGTTFVPWATYEV